MARGVHLSSSPTAFLVLIAILLRASSAAPFSDFVVSADAASRQQRMAQPIAQSSKSGVHAHEHTPFSSTGVQSRSAGSARSRLTQEVSKNRELRSIGGLPLWPFYQFIDFYEVHTEPEIFQTLQGTPRLVAAAIMTALWVLAATGHLPVSFGKNSDSDKQSYNEDFRLRTRLLSQFSKKPPSRGFKKPRSKPTKLKKPRPGLFRRTGDAQTGSLPGSSRISHIRPAQRRRPFQRSPITSGSKRWKKARLSRRKIRRGGRKRLRLGLETPGKKKMR